MKKRKRRRPTFVCGHPRTKRTSKADPRRPDAPRCLLCYRAYMAAYMRRYRDAKK